MILLNKPIESFTFDDIVEFCKEGNVEGFQLDYKKELPAKGLSKHFASFSNSRGGVIIVGVEEDATAKPSKYEGIVFDSKLVDKIHQYATNVDPRPDYDLKVTNEVQGKVFILIRIYEGDRTPYYVHNDANIYVRTGNITDPIDLAKPEAVELLFGKKEKAELARTNYIKRAREIYDAALQQGNKERLKKIAEERAEHKRNAEEAVQQGLKPPAYKTIYASGELGTEVSLLKLLLQPFFPKKALMPPNDIKSNMEQIKFRHGSIDFPYYSPRPIQDGLIHFQWGEDGSVECQQLYSTGLVYHADDVLRQDQEHGKRIYLDRIAVNLFMFLRGSANFYSTLGYQGSLIGHMELKDINGAKLKRLVPNGYRPGLWWDRETEIPLMNDYTWKIDIDTSLLKDDLAFQKYFINFIREIYWSLGYEDVEENLLKAFLKDQGWLIEETTSPTT